MEIGRDKFERLKELPFFKGTVITGSMVPVIKIGESITVEVGQKDLKRFDIIVFYHDGKLICHYLWNLNQIVMPMLMQTRSLNGRKDYPIKPQDYLGKVVSHKINWWRKIRILFW